MGVGQAGQAAQAVQLCHHAHDHHWDHLLFDFRNIIHCIISIRVFIADNHLFEPLSLY